jgi:CDP-glucose 4,6-dehydratase
VQAEVPVGELVKSILEIWPGEWEQCGGADEPYEAKRLSLAIDKAATILQWFPTWSFAEAIQQTVSWYHQRHVLASKDMLECCLRQLETFAAAGKARRLAWALMPAT